MKKLSLWFLVLVVLANCSQESYKVDKFAPNRDYYLYSDIRYSEESGDFIGTEVLLTKGESGYTGYIQICQGWPSNLKLISNVNINQDSKKITFNIGNSGSFNGIINDGYISGEISLSKDFIMDIVRLQRVELYKKK